MKSLFETMNERSFMPVYKTWSPVVGQPYWYINDRMELVSEITKEEWWSESRIMAGNCFPSLRIAEMVLKGFERTIKEVENTYL